MLFLKFLTYDLSKLTLKSKKLSIAALTTNFFNKLKVMKINVFNCYVFHFSQFITSRQFLHAIKTIIILRTHINNFLQNL